MEHALRNFHILVLARLLVSTQFVSQEILRLTIKTRVFWFPLFKQIPNSYFMLFIQSSRFLFTEIKILEC